MAQWTQIIQNNWENGSWTGAWASGDSLYSSFARGKNYYGNDCYCALRFTNVSVPKGSTINSAYLRFTAEENKSANIYSTIYGLDEDNTSDFHSDPVGRTYTTASLAWQINGQTLDTQYTSGDIGSIVAEIMGRASWSSGNSIGLILREAGSTSNDTIGRYWTYYGASAKGAYLEINYTAPVYLVSKDLLYRIRRPMTAVTKLLRYCITDPEDTPVTFTGIKIAKAGHNVLNTSNPDNLKFSSDYNTLKYYLSGTYQMHITVNSKNGYNYTAYVNHNLGYYPFAIVYAKDDLRTNYSPLGIFQAGSGAYRQFFCYVTANRLYIVVDGWSMSGDDDFYVDFYYKIFKNNLNL
jgi:hypothetical protein